MRELTQTELEILHSRKTAAEKILDLYLLYPKYWTVERLKDTFKRPEHIIRRLLFFGYGKNGNARHESFLLPEVPTELPPIAEVALPQKEPETNHHTNGKLPMKTERKERIVSNILEYQTNKKMSQNMLANEIGISPGHMSNIIGGIENEEKWKNISEDLWNKLSIKFDTSEWRIYETANFRAIHRICKDMQAEGETACIAEYTGAGKSVGLRTYAYNTENAFYIQCNQLLTKKDLLREIQRSLGIYSEGRIVEMLEDIIKELSKKPNPLLIIDEADKLNDPCMMILKVIYDRLEYQCGFVMAGTEVLWQKIDKNASRNKLGYRELKRRFFNNTKALYKFNTTEKRVKDEIEMICREQGVDDTTIIKQILESATNFGDVRTMVRTFHRLRKKEAV